MGLDGVELVLECEDKFGINIGDLDAERTETVGQLQHLCIRLIQEQTDRSHLSDQQKSELNRTVREIVSEQLGLDLDRVRAEDRFIQDLGMD